MLQGDPMDNALFIHVYAGVLNQMRSNLKFSGVTESPSLGLRMTRISSAAFDYSRCWKLAVEVAETQLGLMSLP